MRNGWDVLVSVYKIIKEITFFQLDMYRKERKRTYSRDIIKEKSETKKQKREKKINIEKKKYKQRFCYSFLLFLNDFFGTRTSQ